MSQGETDLIIRVLDGMAEFKEAERLQIAVWGKDDIPDNSDILLAIQHEGGLVAGAFRDGRMVGFIFGFPTATGGVQHSHRLAVHVDARGLGLGARMKWYQRDWCLARGITQVRWTFDPLRAINAGLNINRLGATSATYHIDYYGPMPGINMGLPSDRLLTEWQLDAPNVQQLAQGLVPPAATVAQFRIPIPPDIDRLVTTDLKAALAVRLQVRAAMTKAFAEGLQVSGFDAGAGSYLLNDR